MCNLLLSDLAIGAPNSEQVFVYRTYPMVTVNSYFSFTEISVKPEVKSLNMSACLSISLPEHSQGTEIGKTRRIQKFNISKMFAF
jgi:hypothetical protein